MRLLRRSELVIVLWLAWTVVAAHCLEVKPQVRQIVFVLNLTIIAGYFLLAYADSLRRRLFLGIARDCLPAPLLLIAYREVGWFAPERHTYELVRSWVLWDKWLLNDFGLKAAIEFFGPALPSLLEISYSLVYAVPYFSLALLYACRRRERIDQFLFPLCLAVLSVYAMLPFFPSEPPRTVFPGEDFPSHDTVFRRFNWWLLGGYGIHTGVFPSAHVSSSTASALAMIRLLPEKKWVGRFLFALAILIASATVYGRYHYAVDALAGAAIALAAVGAQRMLKLK
jgi:membrane-associated phospholipid phosphatase